MSLKFHLSNSTYRHTAYFNLSCGLHGEIYRTPGIYNLTSDQLEYNEQNQSLIFTYQNVSETMDKCHVYCYLDQSQCAKGVYVRVGSKPSPSSNISLMIHNIM